MAPGDLDSVPRGPFHAQDVSQDARVKARQPAPHTYLRAAADGSALLLTTLCPAFHASTDGAVHRGPHLSVLGRESTRFCCQLGAEGS